MGYTHLLQQSTVHVGRTICGLALCLVFGLMVGCAQTEQYTSKDLTVLPCERKANEFFFPLEFDKAGNQVYADQAPAIENALHHADRVYVFVHGWNKTPQSAEGDYQDLICRFYTHSKHDPVNAKRSIVIGVFWPSADFPPLLNFWRMKSRADDLALTGFQSLIKLLANPAIESGGHYDLVLIGHSFGGRIILKGITHYIAELTPEKHHFLSSLNQLQLILLTTAMGEDILLPYQQITEDNKAITRKWNPEDFLQEMIKQYGREFTRKELLLDVLQLRLQWHPTLVELSGLTDLRIYNIFSTHDDANRFLYPIGSFMEHGGPTCAIGACGVFQWPDIVFATSGGSVESVIDLAVSNLWNIEASKIIFSHTDIYKGRVENLVWELIDLPKPQYTHTESLHFIVYPGRTDSQVEVSKKNRIAMLNINNLRQMGEAGMKSVNESSTLAFAVDGELQKENWVAAEKGIKEIIKLQYFYPGWFVSIGIGNVLKGLFIDSSGVSTQWYPLSKVSIHLLLAYVLVEQGKCDEANQVLDEYVRPSPLYQNEEKKFLEAFGSYEVRLLNCHELQ